MSRIIAKEPFARKTIAPGMRVTLHFSLLLDDGREIDTTRRGKPATFVLGDGNLPESFEVRLIGLQPADDRQFDIPAEEGFGVWRAENLRKLPRDRFARLPADEPLEPGLVMSFREPGGETPGVVRRLLGDMVEVDFNHPLAGRNLIFDVSIIAVGDHSSGDDYRLEPLPS